MSEIQSKNANDKAPKSNDSRQAQFSKRLEIKRMCLSATLPGHCPARISRRLQSLISRSNSGDGVALKHPDPALPAQDAILVGFIALQMIDRLIARFVLLRNHHPHQRTQHHQDRQVYQIFGLSE